MRKAEAYKILEKWARKYDDMLKGPDNRPDWRSMCFLRYDKKDFRKAEKKLIDEILANRHVLEPFDGEEMIIKHLRRGYGDNIAIAIGGSDVVSPKRKNKNYTVRENGKVKFRDLDIAMFIKMKDGRIPATKSRLKFPKMEHALFGFLMLVKRGFVEEKIEAKRKGYPKYEMTIHNSQFADINLSPKERPAYYGMETDESDAIVKNLARLGLKPIYGHDFVKAYEHTEKAVALLKLLHIAPYRKMPEFQTLDEIAKNFVGKEVLYKHQADWSEDHYLDPHYYKAYNNPEVINAIKEKLPAVLEDLKKVGAIVEKRKGKEVKYGLTEGLRDKMNYNHFLKKVWGKRAPKPKTKRKPV